VAGAVKVGEEFIELFIRLPHSRKRQLIDRGDRLNSLVPYLLLSENMRGCVP
jgi:hypothetical protein